MLKNIKAVIFDMDGTLIDSMWLWKTIDMEYLKRFGLMLPDDLQDDIEGMSFSETAAYFKKRFNLLDSVETIKEEWNKMAWSYYIEEVTMKEDAHLFLSHLKHHGYKTGIGTSNSKELVTLVMNKFKIDHFFHSIRTSCEVAKGKPSPDIYLQVAKDLMVLPEECLVFEDVPMGIMAAKNAGMKVCAIYDDFSKNITDEKIRLADYYVNGYTDVMQLIRNEA
ncbi:MAG: HAD family hydrolase [Firmicutes bacterium HGW-Firmicutes-2]|jgi:HAD superfamily hydrolase (TIGR01549 family)|nr:MAG: HAD family hydrolase [Firmicutes bacterium HGW-Firmicutes-2]